MNRCACSSATSYASRNSAASDARTDFSSFARVAAAAFWSRLSPDRRVFDAAIGLVLVLTILVPTTLAGWGWLGDTLATPFYVLAERLSQGLG